MNRLKTLWLSIDPLWRAAVYGMLFGIAVTLLLPLVF